MLELLYSEPIQSANGKSGIVLCLPPRADLLRITHDASRGQTLSGIIGSALRLKQRRGYG